VFKDVTQAGAVREQGPERCRIRRVVEVTHNRNVLQPLLSPFVVNRACSLCLPTPLLVRVFLSAETFAFEVIDEVLPSAMVFRSNAFTRSNRFSKLNDARRIAASGWGNAARCRRDDYEDKNGYLREKEPCCTEVMRLGPVPVLSWLIHKDPAET
jgi:hypothetical protein